MEIQTTVAGGLPCIASVISYSPARSNWRSSWEHSLPDDDEEIEFELLTLKGKPAPWIEARASEEDLLRIDQELSEAYYKKRNDL